MKGRAICWRSAGLRHSSALHWAVEDFNIYGEEYSSIIYDTDKRNGGSKDENGATSPPGLPRRKIYIFLSEEGPGDELTGHSRDSRVVVQCQGPCWLYAVLVA